MKSDKKIQSYLLPVLASAILMGAGYCFPQYGWPLMLVGFIPLLSTIYDRHVIGRSAFFAGFLFGTIFSSINIVWFFEALPLDWAGIRSPILSISLIAMVWVAGALLAGLFSGLWTVGFSALRIRKPILFILFAAASWTVFEYVHTYAFSILYAGPHSIIGGHWTFGVLGNALAWSPLLLLAPLGGVYLLSFLAVFINATLFMVWRFLRGLPPGRLRLIYSANRPLLAVVGLIVLLMFTSSVTVFLFFRTTTQRIPTPQGPLAAIVHTDFSERASDDPDADIRKAAALRNLLSRIKSDDQSPELLILPEDSQFIASIDAGYRQRYFSDMLGPGEHLVIDSGHISDGAGPDSRAFFYNTLSDLTASATKQVPIPNGEYIPWITLLPLTLAGRDDIVRNFLETRSLKRLETARYGTYGPLRISPLLCSEIFSPTLLRENGIPAPDIIANLSSHSIFHGSKTLGRQTITLGKIRAAENSRPVIIAGNMTPSIIIGPSGRVLASDDGQGPSVTYARIPLSEYLTPYQQYGDWIIVLAIGIAVTAGIASIAGYPRPAA